VPRLTKSLTADNIFRNTLVRKGARRELKIAYKLVGLKRVDKNLKLVNLLLSKRRIPSLSLL
jgi:hypothetical protein